MTKKDIQRGDLVLLRDGRICVVMYDMDDPNKGLTLYGKIGSPFEFIALGKIKHLDSYYDGLTFIVVKNLIGFFGTGNVKK